MAQLHELQQQQASVAKKMRSLHESVPDEKSFTDEQNEEWRKLQKEHRRLGDLIGREKELRELDDQLADEETPPEERGGRESDNPQVRAFDSFLRRGVNDLTAEERAAVMEMRAQAAGTDTAGGFTVPTEFQASVVESMKAYGGIASVCNVINTESGNPIEWATSDGTAEEGEIIGENNQSGEGDVTFGSQTLGAIKLTSKIIRVSNELLRDSAINIEQYLAMRLAMRLGRAEAKYIVNGSGAGTPKQNKGLAASTTAGHTAAAAGKVGWKDVNALMHSVDPAYRNSPGFRFAFNDSTLALLEEEVDGNGKPIWLPEVQGVAPATIRGKQFVVDQGIENTGAAKKPMFAGDFNHFVLRRGNGMAIKRLVERYADFDQTGFIGFHRFDTVLEDTAAVKHLTGK